MSWNTYKKTLRLIRFPAFIYARLDSSHLPDLVNLLDRMTRPHCFSRLLAMLAATFLSTAVFAGDTLRVLTWPGYADADLVKVFEQRTGSRVEVTLIDTDDALWEKISMHQAQDFDVFAVNTAELQRYVSRELVLPIDTAALPNLATQLPRFRDLKAIPGIVHGSSVYAIPYTYAEMGLIYDRKQVTDAPDSITALWDPRYRGKVLAYNSGTHNFSLAMQSLGKKTPFRLTPQDWPAAVDQLIALRRNALSFYTHPDESVELFLRHGAALMLANYGTQQLQLLKQAGADVGYVIPKEGALAWLDCWTITRGARNKALAEAWINYMLEKEAGQALVVRQGLANTTSPAPTQRPTDQLIWLEPVENVERRELLWERIVSGYRASRVLLP
jgi:putative spermidine/putrescine transport system substrate-binding protein